MTMITLEVPDALAARISSMQQRVFDLLSAAYMPNVRERVSWLDGKGNFAVVEEVLNFLAGGPAREQIAAFKSSDAVQQRLEFLLDKNREQSLTEVEIAELGAYEQIEHMMILLKARASASPPQQSQ